MVMNENGNLNNWFLNYFEKYFIRPGVGLSMSTPPQLNIIVFIIDRFL